MNNIYQAFIVTGDYERGAFSCFGKTYTEAAKQFGDHYNKCSFNRFGSTWKEVGQKAEGMPTDHMYLVDDKGNKLLLVDTHEKTTFLCPEFLDVSQQNRNFTVLT